MNKCRWMLYCNNPATHTVAMPTMGRFNDTATMTQVPVCERCWHMANGNR